jgi:Holliday junction resolvase RusA-like endonuclease
MHECTLTIPMPPSINACWRETMIHGQARRVRTGDYKRWLRHAGGLIVVQRPPRLTSDVEVLIEVGPRNRGADIDNRIKPTLDLLVAQQVIADDRYVTRVTAEWAEGWTGEPGARITITARQEHLPLEAA